MAGTNADFNAASFAQSIKDTWRMARPSDRPVRIFQRAVQTSVAPFNPATSAQISGAESYHENGDWGIEYFDTNGIEQGPFGMYPPARLVISVFQEDWEEIEDPYYAQVDGETYYFTGELAPVTLFDAQIRRLSFERKTA